MVTYSGSKGGKSQSASMRGNRQTPNEPFKQSVRTTLRAIAADNEVEVKFSTDKASLAGKVARLPEPPRDIAPEQAAALLRDVARLSGTWARSFRPMPLLKSRWNRCTPCVNMRG